MSLRFVVGGDSSRMSWLALGCAVVAFGACSPAESGGTSGFVGAGGVTTDPTVTATGAEEETTAETTGTDASATGDGDGDGDSDPSTEATTDDGSTDASMAFCGDELVEGFEACDCGSDGECTLPELDNKGCEDVLHEESGNNYDGGVLTCNFSCQFDVTGCYVCGDGVKEETEPCDGTQFGNASCGSEGFLGGNLACTPDCQLDTSGCSEATWSDDFESADFSAATYTFAGSGQWSVTTDAANSGTHAASSNAITSNQTVELAMTIDFAAAGTIAFFHKEGCEGTFDGLSFYIDTTLQQEWTGTNDWAEATFPVAAGVHQMRWVYGKDGSVDVAPDKAWVDDIRTDGTPQ